MKKNFKGWSLRSKSLGVQAVVTQGGIAQIEVAGLGAARRAQIFRRLSNGTNLFEEVLPRWEQTDKWQNREVSWVRGSVLNIEDEHDPQVRSTVFERAMQAIDQAPEALQYRLRLLIETI